ncbi:TVP38/TMEM64 family protein [Runella slithyformis]|uniref:TVP38/TMEM64 family membrane protein n=1 Tax=Runella slithyformis (strain ATCC 29530 / DSM 19594 / LMG 11500 / NCIMB 11436 / LSU 4) TaxID=761193 RepID=A0A7U4E518_RUNSL|nr:VTT domain-containing protein [Runella slithyformis]AEI47859.1 SNARE associated Golgi protein-like protein [Runella slithyformis DSM 19594]
MSTKKTPLLPSLSAFFLTILPFITSSILGAWIIQNETLIQNFNIGDWAIVCIVCALACALALIPPTLLAFAFGYFLGWWALGPLILLNLMAIALVYEITKRLDGETLLRYLSQFPRVNALLNRIQKDELSFVFFTKLSPVLPFALTNLVFSLLKIRFSNVILGGFLGMIPRTALAVWVGMEAKELRQLIENPNESSASRVVVIVLVIVSVVGLTRVLVKRQ